MVSSSPRPLPDLRASAFRSLPPPMTPYQVARKYLGTREVPGKKSNGVILSWYQRLKILITDDETPWCSTFVNFCALESLYERSGKLNARSWLTVGVGIPGIRKAVEGDVLIFERGTSGWQGHVTFLVSYDLATGTARCLGGNQGDAVTIATYDLGKLLGIRRLRRAI